jgi:hypothetical protein
MYLEMLHLTDPDKVPIAYADYDLPGDRLATAGGKPDVFIPLPPPGLGPENMR